MDPPVADLSAAAWGALLFLGIACSGLGYLLWYGALEQLDTGQVRGQKGLSRGGVHQLSPVDAAWSPDVSNSSALKGSETLKTPSTACPAIGAEA